MNSDEDEDKLVIFVLNLTWTLCFPSFYCNTSYFKVWTTFPIILISYAPLLLVVLAYLQEARLCKCRTRLVWVVGPLYVKIIHENYDIFAKGSRQYQCDNVKRQTDVIGWWMGLTITPLMLCCNYMLTFFTARYQFITTLDIILVGGWVRNITSIRRFALPRTASLTDCGLQLFTFADNCIRDFKHIHKSLFSC